MSINYNLKIFNEHLELIKTNNEFFQEKGKIMYAKVNVCKNIKKIEEKKENKKQQIFTKLFEIKHPYLVNINIQNRSIINKNKITINKNRIENNSNVSQNKQIIKERLFHPNKNSFTGNNLNQHIHYSNNLKKEKPFKNNLKKYEKDVCYLNMKSTSLNYTTKIDPRSLNNSFLFNSKIADKTLDLPNYLKKIKISEIQRKKKILSKKLDMLDNSIYNNQSEISKKSQICEEIENKNEVSILDKEISHNHSINSKIIDNINIINNFGEGILENELDNCEDSILSNKDAELLQVYKDKNILSHTNVINKIFDFIENKINFILQDANTKDLFSIV